MPGFKRQRPEEEAQKTNRTKKVKSTGDDASKPDKKFANKLVSKDKKKSDEPYSSKWKKEKDDGGNKHKKHAGSKEDSKNVAAFQELSVSDNEMEADEEEGGVPLEQPKSAKMPKGDVGKISSAPAALKGSTDGVNGIVYEYSVSRIDANARISDQFPRIAYQAEGNGARAQSSQAKCGRHTTSEEAVGEAACQVQGREDGAGEACCRTFRYRIRQRQRIRVQARQCAAHSMCSEVW
jgi:hypothetical protein